MTSNQESYWEIMWKRFRRHRLGYWSLWVVVLFCLVGIYAPFLASSKPLFVMYDGHAYFPLFRYLFYSGFFTKLLDIFFNLLIFTLPFLLLALWLLKGEMRRIAVMTICIGQLLLFTWLVYFPLKDPASDVALNRERQKALKEAGKNFLPSWDFDLKYMTPYGKLNLLLRCRQRKLQQETLMRYSEQYSEIMKSGSSKNNDSNQTDSQSTPTTLPTLWQVQQEHEQREFEQQSKRIEQLKAEGKGDSEEYLRAQAQLNYLLDRRKWLEDQSAKIKFEIMPLLSPFHWEDDAGGQDALNQVIPWWEVTRINRKDLLAALIFGVRISLTVGIISVALALAIGVPIGALAGFYAGRTDIVVCRLLEIWEAMPVFFMLLMVVGVLQSKSIFVVTAVIGFFSWTQFSRYIRGEFFKQRNLPYVEACQALGFKNGYIMFKHILPNAIPPVLTLLPFAIMGAITSEAGLSFLGLGEEGSASWGVLMDEGRTAFPEESYLLWPPAILLTILLVAIALVGDSMRDTLDPKRS